MMLAGIPVADRHVLELAGRLRDAGEFENVAVCDRNAGEHHRASVHVFV